MERVELSPIREAVISYIVKGGTYAEICLQLGWVRGDGKCETDRVKRAIGIMPRGRKGLGKKISYQCAVEIVRAIDRAPNEVGL